MKKTIGEGFFENYKDDLCDYFEECKAKSLLKKPEYLKKLKRIEEINAKYPNIKNFFDENEIVDFTKEEMEKILEYLNLKEDLYVIEEKEIFKLGFKEACIFLTE